MEWENIVARMRTAERAGQKADISEYEADVITRYLQKNFLSAIPTVLPEHVMRFLKRHLWRMDFGERDLFLDVIYLPKQFRRLLPYLAMTQALDRPEKQNLSLFVVYLNTHQGVVPQWNLAEMVTISDEDSTEYPADAWKVLYEGGQKHHRQGLLTFSKIPENRERGRLEMTIRLPNMRKRVFQWVLPVPPLEDP